MTTDSLVTYLAKIGRRNSAADVERLQAVLRHLQESIALLHELGLADAIDSDAHDPDMAQIATDGIAEPIRSIPADAMTAALADSSGERLVVSPANPPTDPPTAPPTDPPTAPPTDPLTAPPTDPLTAPPTDPPESFIKTLGPGRLGHYAVVWGDPNRRDLYGEYFTPQTADLDAIFKAIGKLPLLYHHGLDATMRSTVVGIVDTMRTDPIGLWVESQLNMANAYAEAILQLADQKKLGTSTGTLPGVREVGTNGEIRRWAIAEVSLTPTPAEPRMRREVPVQVLKTYYDALGLSLPAMKPDESDAKEASHQALALERERIRLLALTL